ncbi:membrane bound O-acyl transferase family-domain-containing protein [Phaeosphaeria sp. MPI-PUGE-AT-0046c]|nr:membrane bound O-acyl transferase family-domain-containing protein [Phaeosphaeria sp. MPI-PUGE-AT-0046c]
MSSLSLELPQSLIAFQVPLLYLVNIFALALGPKHNVLRYGLTLPLFVLLVAQSLYRDWDGVFGMHYALGCMVLSVAFTYVEWNLLRIPDKEKWRKIRYVQGKEEVEDVVGDGFWERAWWGVRLAMGNRYVGWTQESKNVVKEVGPEYSRVRFVLRKALRAAMFHVLHNAANAYTAASPYGSWDDIKHVKPIDNLVDRPFLTRWSYTWFHIILTYTALEELNAAYGAVSVATGFASPQDCPSAFGDLRELVTVRKAWSRVWHQQCRHLCSSPGIFITRDVLHLRKGSFGSKYLQLIIGFGVSGIVHGGASMFVYRSFGDDAAIAYFLGQAFIIMVEDHVIELGKSVGFKDSVFWRFAGFAWTVFALGASTQAWTARLVRNGMWIHERGQDYLGLGP